VAHRLAAGHLQPDPGRRVVVEALGEPDVLVGHRVADAAPHSLAVRGVADRARAGPDVGGVGRRGHRHVPDDLQQLGDRSRRVDDLTGDVEVALAHAVELPDLHPVHAERVGELVHQRLVREGSLHAAEPAHGPARRVVRVDAVRVDRDRGDVVGAEAQGAGVADDRRGGRRVGAAVEQHVRLRVDQGAVALGAELVGHPRGVPVDVAVEGLLAAVAHLHRLAGAQRQQAGVHVHREVLAAAERAADPGQGQPHLLRRHAERQADLPLVDVQPLGRHVQVHAAVLGRDGQPGLRAEERLVLHADLEVEGDDHRRGGLRIAASQLQVPDQVALVVDRRCVGVHGATRVGDRGQHLVVDGDPCGRPAGGLGMVRGDQCDRFPLVAHELRGEHRLVGVLEAVGVVPGDVVGGQHRPDPGHRERLGDVDPPDAGVRMRAAQRDAPAHLVVPEVAGVGELAGDLQGPVRPERAVTDASGRRCRRRDPGARVGAHGLTRSAASRTASRIFS
jgi:hypothetical protein